jgi:hypothetical protein
MRSGFGLSLPKSFLFSISAGVALSLLASGCASVKIVSGPETSSVLTSSTIKPSKPSRSERAALLAATRKVQETPWPRIEKASLSDRMVGALFGGDKQERDSNSVTRDEAVAIYVERLNRQPSPVSALMQDANQCLTNARHLAESGRVASTSITPRDNDIALLEEAIGDIRQSRDIYLAAMKKLRNNGESLSRDEIKDMKHAFTQTIADLGITADAIHDKIAETGDTAQYAGN